LSDLAQSINDLDAGVAASVISVDGVNAKLLITAENSGAASNFSTSSTISSLASTSVVQQGTDAQMTVGSGPGALTITRSSNSITDLVAGVTIDLNQTSASAVTVTVGRDIDAALEKIGAFVTEVNSTLQTLSEYTAYNADAQAGGVLAGDATARGLAFDLRSAISSTVNENSTSYPIASSIGISLSRTGTFDFSESELRAALEDDFDEVMGLLLESGSAIDSRMSFAGAGASTVEGDYDVVITQAASSPTALSDKYQKPNSDTTFQIVVGTETVDVSVLKNDNIGEALQAITDALTAAGVTQVTATQIAQSGDDHIQLSHTSVGSAASFQVVGDPFGLAGIYTGTDVAGTIGGEAATGVGQTLTATAGDPNGMSVRISASQSEVDGAGGSLSLGLVSYEKGLFGNVDGMLDEAEGSGGRIDRARNLWKAQIEAADDRIDILLDRIDRKEALLMKQFAALETAMSTLSSQAAWLAAQLGSTSNGQSA
jgi:flagellar hook-associated protein 2